MRIQKIHNIVFDLGGVILPIYPQQTSQAFQKLASRKLDLKDVEANVHRLVRGLETGLITADIFVAEVGRCLGSENRPESILDAWNLMLGKLPEGYLTLLHAVRQQHRIFLLSNTNPIHYSHYAPGFINKDAPEGLVSLFEGMVLSFAEGCMKPDPRIYQIFLQRFNLDPGLTLFIDDSQENVYGAQSCGIETLWLEQGMRLPDLFDVDGCLLER